MRTSPAALTALIERDRPRWWVPTVGTLALVLAALLAVATLTGPPAASGPPVLESPISQMGKKTKAPVSRIASFNVLGANHTDGRRANKPRFASSRVRTPQTAQILFNNGVDIVGFQEMNRKQHDQLMRVTDGEWDAYPGDELSHYATHNSIAWRTAEWRRVEVHTIPITYFHGTRVPMPYVLLRHKATKRLLWVANFHNPASTRSRGDQSKWRRKAKNDQIDLANRLNRTGVPVILTGDMNERESYFCSMTSRAPMKSASGGSEGTRRCVPPRPSGIDWIFGSTDLRLFNYLLQRTPLTEATTDHPIPLVDVAIPRSTRR